MSKKKEGNDIWALVGKRHYLTEPSVEQEKLENAVYSLHIDGDGRFYLIKTQDKFTFDYKLYGLESKLVERIVRTHQNTTNNLGVLLNGLKGTGKTVTSKVICNQLNQPVVVIGRQINGSHSFINSIPQDITVFIDEYEKIFGNSSDMLTIMDGALNSKFRRVFLLTTNELNVDSNLIQRPSRIRYLKKFVDLSPIIVEEIITDVLVHKELHDECVKFMSTLEVITVDIVKAVLAEVNIHHESPKEFSDVFNIRVLKGNYDVQIQETTGKFATVFENQYLNQRPSYSNGNKGNWLVIDDNYYGKITKIINYNTIEVSPINEGNGRISILDKPTIFKMVDSELKHYSYTHGGFEGYGVTAKELEATPLDNGVTASSFFKLLEDAIAKENSDDDDDYEEEGVELSLSAG
jgi:hypothetical protein